MFKPNIYYPVIWANGECARIFKESGYSPDYFYAVQRWKEIRDNYRMALISNAKN